MSEADLVILVGRKLDYQLAYGSPAIFSNATFTRISDNPYELVDNRRGEPEIYAEPKLVFETINRRKLNINFDKNWIMQIQNFHNKKLENLKNTKEVYIGDDNKIHPNYIFNCISNLSSK